MPSLKQVKMCVSHAATKPKMPICHMIILLLVELVIVCAQLEESNQICAMWLVRLRDVST